MAFARYIVRPGDGIGGPSRWMQAPVFRLVAQGPAWVACFFILSGFVNSLKPIKLARAGQVDTALSNLAVSSFRRSWRLFLPATAATIISWFICQFGGYETARLSDAYWLYITSPSSSPTWGLAIEDLFKAIQRTWTYNPDNIYDQPQWALLYLLQGSMLVFTALLVSIFLTPRFRVFCLAVCWFLSWNWGSRLGDRTGFQSFSSVVCLHFPAIVGLNVYAGVMLAELNYSRYPLLLSQYSPYFAPPMVLTALVFMSFPSQFHNHAHWSETLLRWHYKIAPPNAEVQRFFPSLGAQLLILTAVLSPHLRRILSQRYFLWLGKISFPLYLLHGTIMRTVLAWLLFSRSELVEMQENSGGQTYVLMKYPIPGYTMFFIAIPIFFVILFSVVHVWAQKVEPHFGIMTKYAEDLMFGRKQERPAVLPVRQD